MKKHMLIISIFVLVLATSLAHSILPQQSNTRYTTYTVARHVHPAIPVTNINDIVKIKLKIYHNGIEVSRNDPPTLNFYKLIASTMIGSVVNDGHLIRTDGRKMLATYSGAYVYPSIQFGNGSGTYSLYRYKLESPLPISVDSIQVNIYNNTVYIIGSLIYTGDNVTVTEIGLIFGIGRDIYSLDPFLMTYDNVNITFHDGDNITIVYEFTFSSEAFAQKFYDILTRSTTTYPCTMKAVIDIMAYGTQYSDTLQCISKVIVGSDVYIVSLCNGVIDYTGNITYIRIYCDTLNTFTIPAGNITINAGDVVAFTMRFDFR